jgi:tetratricopeptide (TPR) repeat protein
MLFTSKLKHILSLTILLISTLISAQNDVLFTQGNDLYNEGKYAEAIDRYTEILDSGNHSEALYFNLANAHYKLNNIAPSIYYYEKAMQLAPNDADIKNNIAFARNMTIDAIDVIPEGVFSKIAKRVINIMSFDYWALFAVISMLLFVILFLGYYFAYSTSKKRLAFVGTLASLFLLLCTLTLAFEKYHLHQKDNPAIVFAQEAKVKGEPNLRSEEAFRLHEGTKVQVLDTIKNWRKIKLTDGKTGWISSDDIKMLKKF